MSARGGPLPLFKAKTVRGSQLGVCAAAHGITAALVRTNAQGAPELQWARHVETADVPSALSALAHQSDTRNVNCASLVQAGDYSWCWSRRRMCHPPNSAPRCVGA